MGKPRCVHVTYDPPRRWRYVIPANHVGTGNALFAGHSYLLWLARWCFGLED
jgi:hypothetical protein